VDPLGLDPSARARLTEIFERAQAEGLLGPASVGSHIDHSLAFGALVLAGTGAGAPATLLDLGSGAGVPGLVLALALPDTALTLLDGRVRRAAFLREAVRQLDLGRRVGVVAERAETAGHSELRASCDAVVARGFGPPAVTAECGAPLLAPGGLLVVSDPPVSSASGEPVGDPSSRWPTEPLVALGLAAHRHVACPWSFTVLRAVAPCPSRYPRRTGIPGKRPLFG
jgi:16S rRNA (guanine527-N7)-methyltransferase